MSDNEQFCSNCGVKLDSNSHYCPSCGLRVPGRNEAQVAEEREAVAQVMKSRPRWAAYLMLVYGIPLLCLGIYYYIDASAITDALWDNSTFVDTMDDLGVTMSEYEQYIEWFGMAWVVSGVSAIASAMLCFVRKFYYLALVVCLISAIFSISGIFALLMSLLAFWLVVTSKFGFAEFEGELNEELQKIQ